jgi:tripartite-type tricarboxylate transporter receptor subunit TctC
LAGHIKSGKLRALLVSTKDRLDWAPDVPTVSELGYPKLEKMVGWSGLFGPSNMDPATVKILRDALQKVKVDKAWNKFTKALGSVPYILDGPGTKKFVDEQYTAFKTLVDKLGMGI